MTEIDKLSSELEAIEQEVEQLSDARRTEVKRRYKVIYASILNLHTVEKRQKEFSLEVQSENKSHNKTALAMLVAYFGVLFFVDLGEHKSTLNILFFIWMLYIWTKSAISEAHVKQISNQFFVEINRLKTDVASMTYSDGLVISEFLEILRQQEGQEPNFALLNEKKLQWQIDVHRALINEV